MFYKKLTLKCRIQAVRAQLQVLPITIMVLIAWRFVLKMPSKLVKVELKVQYVAHFAKKICVGKLANGDSETLWVDYEKGKTNITF